MTLFMAGSQPGSFPATSGTPASFNSGRITATLGRAPWWGEHGVGAPSRRGPWRAGRRRVRSGHLLRRDPRCGPRPIPALYLRGTRPGATGADQGPCPRDGTAPTSGDALLVSLDGHE